MLFDVVFTGTPVRNYRDIQGGDAELAVVFNAAVREKGILKPAAKLYPHLALSEADLAQTEAAFAHAAARVAPPPRRNVGGMERQSSDPSPEVRIEAS